MQKIKYITNKALLAEIKTCKASFCSFVAPEYATYDAIVTSIDLITDELVAETMISKAHRLSTKAAPVTVEMIDPATVVFRVMTDGHLPPADEKKRRLTATGETIKTNFNPFRHYVLNDGQLIEVGRSHWKGDFESGKFNVDHGKINNQLALMFILLVEQYSKRGNWRGYCVDQETEALTQRGWLGTDEINEDDIILSYDEGKLKWSKIKSIFRDDFDGKMFKLTVTGMDALVTPGHKFVTDKGLKEVEYLVEKDRLILMGDAVEDGSGEYSDDYVETVGRFIASGDTETRNPALSMSFIVALTKAQRESLIKSITRPEDGYVSYKLTDRKALDGFLMLCALNGRRTTTRLKDGIYRVDVFSQTDDRYQRTTVADVDFYGGKRIGPNEPTIDYKGKVWCPETEYGSFMARRNGTVYLTGNSYIDEMRSHAMVQLAQVGLQFDESRSSNPFAFLTQVVKNCLSGETLILTREYGSVPIEQVANQDVTLLDGNGDWIKSHIHDYGVQETVNLNFSGYFEKVSVRSTMDHGWVQRDTGERINTCQFVERNGYATKNIVIADLRPSKTIKDEVAYKRGIIHGIVYGDGGSYNNKNSHGFGLRLCNEKAELLKWFDDYDTTYPPFAGGDPYVSLKRMWCDLKALPESPGESLDYLLGFFRGWLATDGCVSTEGDVTICGDRAEADWIAQWGSLIGWHTGSFALLNEQTNYGTRHKKSGNFKLRKRSMVAEDFLRTQHNERFVGTTFEGPSGWRVYPGNRQNFERRMEKVYCPDVPTTHTFALANGIHQTNCFRRILNLERRTQEIRDDLLLMAGAMPSYTRQVDNEIEQRENNEPEKPGKRGRKPKSAG